MRRESDRCCDPAGDRHRRQGRHDPARHAGLQSAGMPGHVVQAAGAEELAHDFLWRIHQHVPAKGFIGIFNRSHYEDVLVMRVHRRPRRTRQARKRCDEISRVREDARARRHASRKGLPARSSKDEQKRRLQARLEDPQKRWKFSTSDLSERRYWDRYPKYLQRGDQRDEHEARAVVRHSRQPQVVPELSGGQDRGMRRSRR